MTNDALAAAGIEISRPARLEYYGGLAGACLPFVFFLGSVITVALSGAPDERGFWPILVGALGIGLLVARNREAYCNTVVDGMAKPIVMIMILAWLLASALGVLMGRTGFVEALIWVAGRAHVGGTGFTLVSFLVCCTVSTATGTSFGTILLCGPLLYPVGGLLGAHPATLAGAILGGATFGDSISPISDTSIASAFSQQADIAGTVRSRLKYVVPAAGASFFLFALSSVVQGTNAPSGQATQNGDPRGLPMAIVPVVVIWLLLSKRHLLHGLLAGLGTGVGIALVTGLLPISQVISLDAKHFTATSFIIDGINRGLGISIFTVFLMGLVAALEASGVVDSVIRLSERRVHGVRAAEAWIVGLVSLVVLLVCHSIVAILTVGEFAMQTGRRFGIHRYRRANLLDLTVMTFPFILPYFIPVLLTSGTTAAGAQYGVPTVPAWQVGLHNFQAFTMGAAVLIAVVTGFGRRFAADDVTAPAVPQPDQTNAGG